MQEKIIYVVECYSGDFEPRDWIAGFFDDKAKAEELKDKIDAEAAKIQKECPPCEEDSDDVADAAFWSFYAKNSKWIDYKKTIVAGYPINKEL